MITLSIVDYTTRRVLIDNGSLAYLADILYYPTFQQMRLSREQLRLVNAPLVGFGWTKARASVKCCAPEKVLSVKDILDENHPRRASPWMLLGEICYVVVSIYLCFLLVFYAF